MGAERVRDREAGRLLKVLRRGLGVPYPLGRRLPRYFMSQKELAQACRVSVDTVRRMERGQLPSLPVGRRLLSFLAARARLLSEEREALFRRVWGGPPQEKGTEMGLPESLASLLQGMPFPAWVHDPFGDILLANELALEGLGLSPERGSSPWPHNLWWRFTRQVSPGGLPELQGTMGALFRHLRVASLPFRARRYWARLCQELYGGAPLRAPIVHLWPRLEAVDADIHLGGLRHAFHVFPFAAPGMPVYLALCVPAGGAGRARGQEVFRLAPWPHRDKLMV